ncbi:hypothetical protein [Streptomyces sp. NPDC001269]
MGSPGGKGKKAQEHGKNQLGSPRSGGTNEEPKDKAKGRRGEGKSRQAAHPSEPAWPRGKGSVRRSVGSQPQPRVVVGIGGGHPQVETGTFDAEALLSSVLGAVEARLEEGFRALEAALAGSNDPASVSQNARTAGRQIAAAVRAGVVEGMMVRDRHLAQLAVIDRAAVQAENLENLQGRIGSELELVGLRRISDLSDLSAFNLVEAAGSQSEAPPEGCAYELVSPAYMDSQTGRTVERGWIRRSCQEETEGPGGKRHGSSSRPHGTGNEALLDDGAGPPLSPISADQEAGTPQAIRSLGRNLAEDNPLPLVQGVDAPALESRRSNPSEPQTSSDTSASDPRSRHVAGEGVPKTACAARLGEDREGQGSRTGPRGETSRRMRAPGAIGGARVSGAPYSWRLLAKPQGINDDAPRRTS